MIYGDLQGELVGFLDLGIPPGTDPKAPIEIDPSLGERVVAVALDTPNKARNAIYTRFLARFRDESSQPILGRDKIVFENEKPTPLVGDFVRLQVLHEGREQITLGKKGNRKFRSSGTVFAQIFTGAGESMSRADSMAKSISDIFDAVSFEGLDFQAATSRESGPAGKSNMSIVEAPFSYEERK